MYFLDKREADVEQVPGVVILRKYEQNSGCNQEKVCMLAEKTLFTFFKAIL